MALLSLNARKAIFKELGLGEYNEKNILAFQKKYLLRKSDYDGIYGQNTDNALRTVYYTKIYTKNFEPQEFRCECGGRYCCGYPSYMKPAELIHIQKIRDHYGKPITVTCGLRDKKYNASLGGSVQNSLHLKGQAIDFYQSGVTDTLANRKKSVKWIKKQDNHHYTYGNGINSNGYSVYAPYMGNALHTDTYDNVKPKHPKWEEPKKEATEKKPTAEKTTKGKQIATTAIGYCGSKDKPTDAYKKAAKEAYGNDKALTQCTKLVGTVLFKSGYPKMSIKTWKEIFVYLRKHFKEIEVDYTEEQLREGDIRVYKNKKGGYHIWIHTQKGQKAEANSKKKYYPHLGTDKASTKHKGDWLFRAK